MEEKGNTDGRQMDKDVKSLTINAQVQIKAVSGVLMVSIFEFYALGVLFCVTRAVEVSNCTLCQ